MRRFSGPCGGLPAFVRGERWAVSGRSGPVRDPAAIAWATRLPSVRLAELVWDSDLDDLPAPPIAGGAAGWSPGAVRRMVFSAPGVTVALEVGPRPNRDLRGWLVPAGPARVEAHGVTWGFHALAVDDAGGFSAPGLPSGPLRILVRAEGQPATVTSWVMID